MAKRFFFFRKRRYTPKDNIEYIIPKDIIQKTENILEDYSSFTPPHEGMAYWAGIKENNILTVLAVIAPKTESDSGIVKTPHKSNFEYIGVLSEHNLIHLAQVHSHPSDWIDHSEGDDMNAAFKIKGLLSIVVPAYCERGMFPLAICGVHRYINWKFIRLSNKYISTHFHIKNNIQSKFIDLR